ncbi:MAG: glycerophosphodiester phosphodiesterase [Clostridia bacterium]|nr:glycerophosphodiester phosphodiesterase [Clostridia bacterium]
MNKTLILAHRGACAYAPENTLPSFQLAVDMGADGIECDIHLTKDGHFLVCHDDKVQRTSNGKGYIKDLTLSEVKSLDFGAWFDKKFAGVTAPVLEEMLDVVKNMKVINIEIKRFEGCDNQDEALNRFYSVLTGCGVLKNTIVSSFDKQILKRLKELHADVYTCLLYDKIDRPAFTAQSIGCSAIHPHFGYLKKVTVDNAHARNLKVNCWTADGEEDIARMLKIGCDGIISNKPDVAMSVRSKAK